MNRQEFEQLEPSKLLDKITELNKELFKMSPRSPVFNQLRGIIGEAQQVYQEHLMIQRYDQDNEHRSSVLNIGEIESEIIEEFELFDNWIDKYDYLIDLGKSLPKIDDSQKTKENILKL